MLGTISKPQGLQGGVRMWPEFDDREKFELLKTDRLFLKTGGSIAPVSGLKPKPVAFYELTLEEFSEHQRFLVLFFEGVKDADAAETLRSVLEKHGLAPQSGITPSLDVTQLNLAGNNWLE